MTYKIFWTDMHSNIHHEDIALLPKWLEHAKELIDFWPIAYYPYTMRLDKNGLKVEDIFPLEDIQPDWNYVKEVVDQANKDGFTMFAGYEWQGAGLDGDHNVFFKDSNQDMKYPLRYDELYQSYKDIDAIAIPHHLAYQLEHRGKNWETHNETFSPFVEIYSSHGSSENDTGPIDMVRHVHMGPRTGVTSVEQGWKRGKRFGVIAAGDNHSVPCVYGFGYTAVLAKTNSKEDIWDAFMNRRVYGVSQEKIQIHDFSLDDVSMGGSIKSNPKAILKLNVTASNAIDRIEIIEDNIVSEMIPNTSTWEKLPYDEVVQIKFKMDLGWGPDRRIFPDIISKEWHGMLHTNGKLLSIEKCWSNFGQKLYNITDNSCEFDCTSYKTTASGKWMGPSAITTEGFIFEISGKLSDTVTLTINGKTYNFTLEELLETSRILPLLDEAKALLKDTFGFEEYYRSDPWWHNAYKIKLGQAVVHQAYSRIINRTIDTTKCTHVRVKIYQKNGSTAWSSPIFIEGV